MKNYLAKIIAKDAQGLNLIAACCFEAKIKISDIKYLSDNKILLVFLQRFNRENERDDEKIVSVCKFEFIDKVRARNIDQKSNNTVLELLTIDLLKFDNKYEINLIFSNNAYITLSTEIIEATLEDQDKEKNYD